MVFTHSFDTNDTVDLALPFCFHKKEKTSKASVTHFFTLFLTPSVHFCSSPLFFFFVFFVIVCPSTRGRHH